MLASNAAIPPNIVESAASRRSCHNDASTSSCNVRTSMNGNSGSRERKTSRTGIESIDHGTVNRGWNRLSKRAVFRVVHHADDLIVGSGGAARCGITEALADRIPTREEASCEGLVYDRLTRRRPIPVEPVEVAPGEHVHAHGLEITRRDIVQAAVQEIGRFDSGTSGAQSGFHAGAAHKHP